MGSGARIAYLDLGSARLAMVARSARDGQTMPESLDGKLVVRVAMGLDVLQRLQQQLGQVLTGLRGTRAAKQ